MENEARAGGNGGPLRPLRLGVVGYGYWGPKLARVFGELPECTVAGIADHDPKRLHEAARAHRGTPVFHRVSDLLAQDLDGVAIATPIRSHARLAMRALAAGLDVFVEKPLAALADEAETMVAAAVVAGKTLMVGHTFVYHPAVEALRALVADGVIGDVLYLNSARLNLGLFQRDINVLWDLARTISPSSATCPGCEPLSVSARGAYHVRKGVCRCRLRAPGAAAQRDGAHSRQLARAV